MTNTFNLTQTLEPFFAIYGLKNKELEQVLKISRTSELKKGQRWIAQGSSVSEVGFVLKGAFKKVLSTPDGREVVKGFAFENEPLAPFSSLLRGKEAVFSIDAIEDSLLVCCSYSDLRELELGTFWRLLAEEHFIESENRELELLSNQSKKMFENLINNRSDLLKRINSKDLASYLGIHPVTLSRLRANFNKKRI
jgi:CRP-like cAMP-binding protein